MSQTQFRGIYPMLYAFFNAADQLDRDAMRQQVMAMINAGCHGIAIGGLASETNKLSTAERLQLINWVAEDINGQLPLSVTIAENNVAGQVAVAKAAQDAGAAWVVLQPPQSRGAGEAELMKFYGAVADQVDIPVGIQNAPEYIGIGLSNSGFAQLNKAHPNISIIKAEGPALYIRQLAEATEGSYTLFNGRNGIELTDSLRAGCTGLIPGAETADIHTQIFNDLSGGRELEADAAFRNLLPLTHFLMHSIDHLICYGKRLAARRLRISEVYDRTPAQAPHPFGLEIMARLASDLPDFD